MSDEPAPKRRPSGDLQQRVRAEVLKEMRRAAREGQVELTQGSMDYLVTRASDRILRDLGRRKADTGVAAAGDKITEVVDRLQEGAAGELPAQKPPAKLDKQVVRRLVELERICGIFPFC